MADEIKEEENEREDPTAWMEKVSCDIGLRQMVDSQKMGEILKIIVNYFGY